MQCIMQGMSPIDDPAQTGLGQILLDHYGNAPALRVDEHVTSDGRNLFVACCEQSVCLDRHLEWRETHGQTSVLFGHVYAAQCPSCRRILFTLI